MRFAVTVFTGLSLLAISLANTSKADKRPPQVIKPGPPIVPARGKFKLRVQKDARFAKGKRPKASKPASLNGLSITVQPEKEEFTANGPLAFEVVLKNTTKKAITLPSASTLGGKPKLVISNQKTAAQWSLPGKLGDGKVRELQPGKSVTLTVVVEAQFVVPRPIPIPLPRPRPIPLPRRLKDAKGKALQAVVKGQRGIAIRRPIIVAQPQVPVGQGPCNARLFVEFEKKNGAEENKQAPFFTGKLASAVVSFKIGKPGPIWRRGTPLNKQRAIQIAHRVAEGALRGHYKPLAGIRPAKKGPWIESPAKNATAKKDKAGNWRISWTAFPRKGFSYNVTVAVNRFGGATATEVFTGYSKGR